VEQVRILEAVSSLLPQAAGSRVWTPGQSYALAQAVLDRGTRWSLIALRSTSLKFIVSRKMSYGHLVAKTGHIGRGLAKLVSRN